MSGQNINHLLVTITNQENQEIRKKLEDAINDLLVNDFNGLVSILYRIDVNEQELKKMLQLNKGFDAAALIADMLINRQLEKLNSRNSFQPRTDIPEEEKW